MPAIYLIECSHCKGKGKIEIAREVYVNRLICERVAGYYKSLTPDDKVRVNMVLGESGSNDVDYILTQGRHIFTVDELYQLSEVLNCNVADLMPQGNV